MPQRRVLEPQLLDLVLREVADAQGLGRVPGACKRRERAADRLQQRRLARAVRAEESDTVARQDAEVEPREDRRAALVAERGALEQDELARGGRGRRKRELERAVDVRCRNELHALDRPEAALRLLGFRGLRAKTVDERLQVRNLALLFRIGRLLQCELLRAHQLELRVVARVRDELAVVDVHDAVDHAVEEIAVVRDEEQRAGIPAEPVFEPQHGIEVEVVRGLVEQQEIRARLQRLREVQAHAPAAGEARNRVGVPRFLEAEAREERCRTRTRAVAADDLVTVMQLGKRCAVRVRGRKAGFDLAQLGVAVEHELDCAAVDGRRFLRDVRDGPRRGQVDASGIGEELVAYRREQARLAAAVRADEADLVARVHGQARAFEQPPSGRGSIVRFEMRSDASESS